MKKGVITCDTCKKELGKIYASREVFDALDNVDFPGHAPECERFATITCNDCDAVLSATPQELEAAARATDS
jgi:hypothetical protein